MLSSTVGYCYNVVQFITPNGHYTSPLSCLWARYCFLWLFWRQSYKEVPMFVLTIWPRKILVLCAMIQTDCGLVRSWGDMGQHCIRWWLGAIRQQAISWINVNCWLVRFSGIHLRAILQQVPKLEFHVMSLKIIPLKLLPHLPGASGWNKGIAYMCYGIMGLFINTISLTVVFSGSPSLSANLMSDMRRIWWLNQHMTS